MGIKLYQGDCLEVMKSMPEKSIDLVVVDPPYLIETKGGGICGKDGNVKLFKENHLDGMNNGFDSRVLDELCRLMKRTNIYFFCSQKQIIPLLEYFVIMRKCNWNLICWHKINPLPACGNKYLSDTEFILFFREKGVKVYGKYETKRTWYATKTNQKEKNQYKHPTVKPLDIVKNFITNSTDMGGLVLDCFMGTGTTGVACKELGRDFIGIELDEQYFKTAEARINGEK